MKTVLALVVLITGAIGSSEEKYTAKYDNMDLQAILTSKRLLKGYVNCLLEKGPCTTEGADLKKVLPDAIETECSKCSDKQRERSRTVLRYMIDNEPEYWSQLENKYDPNGEYRNKYREQANKEGFQI